MNRNPSREEILIRLSSKYLNLTSLGSLLKCESIVEVYFTTIEKRISHAVTGGESGHSRILNSLQSLLVNKTISDKDSAESRQHYKIKFPLQCLPNDALGECGRNDAMLGCRDGILTDIRDPRRSPPCKSLLSRNSDTFINLGFGVLKMVRFSRQRAL